MQLLNLKCIWSSCFCKRWQKMFVLFTEKTWTFAKNFWTFELLLIGKNNTNVSNRNCNFISRSLLDQAHHPSCAFNIWFICCIDRFFNPLIRCYRVKELSHGVRSIGTTKDPYPLLTKGFVHSLNSLLQIYRTDLRFRILVF